MEKQLYLLTVFAKYSILNLWQGLNMCWLLNFRVLSIPGLSICQGSDFSGLYRIPVFVNTTIMNMSWDLVTEGFWIFQDSKYTRFLHFQALHNVPNMLEYGYIILEYLHGSSPPNFRGDLKISDQNNWVGKPKQKIKFGGELNLKGDLKFQRGAYEPQWCHGCCVQRYFFMLIRF